jgi:hydrogenase/urease accessory protein HupE
MLATLLVASLAIFAVWEFVLVAVPWTIPAWLQPVLVFGAALAFCWPDWRIALAVAGAVGLLHVLVRGVTDSRSAAQQTTVRLPRRVPDLP